MMTVDNWFAAQTHVLGGRSKVDRPIENNTRIVQRGDDFAVQLHSTDVVTFHQDGSVTLDSGGWLTVTTKDRINRYLGRRGRVYSDRGKWFLSTSGYIAQKIPFFDGIRVADNGTVLNPRDPSLEERIEEAENKMGKAIDRYLDGYFAAMERGDVPLPSGGDCWDCSMIVSDGPDKGKPLGDAKSGNDHLIAHLTEKYYVPSLLWNAVNARGYRDLNFIMSVKLDHGAWETGNMKVRRAGGSDEPDANARKDLRHDLRKYLRKRLIPTRATA